MAIIELYDPNRDMPGKLWVQYREMIKIYAGEKKQKKN